jgi:hypothetical protein
MACNRDIFTFTLGKQYYLWIVTRLYNIQRHHFMFIRYIEYDERKKVFKDDE